MRGGLGLVVGLGLDDGPADAFDQEHLPQQLTGDVEDLASVKRNGEA